MLCKKHNMLMSEREFGVEFVSKKIEQKNARNSLLESAVDGGSGDQL